MIGTEYMGLELKSPVIVSSGPLTQNIVSLKKAEEAGAGAVVLKSIFEEQIEADVSSELEGNAEYLAHSSAEEFFAASSRDYYIDRYMKLLTEAKKKLDELPYGDEDVVDMPDYTYFFGDEKDWQLQQAVRQLKGEKVEVSKYRGKPRKEVAALKKAEAEKKKAEEAKAAKEAKSDENKKEKKDEPQKK